MRLRCWHWHSAGRWRKSNWLKIWISFQVMCLNICFITSAAMPISGSVLMGDAICEFVCPIEAARYISKQTSQKTRQKMVCQIYTRARAESFLTFSPSKSIEWRQSTIQKSIQKGKTSRKTATKFQIIFWFSMKFHWFNLMISEENENEKEIDSFRKQEYLFEYNIYYNIFN